MESVTPDKRNDVKNLALVLPSRVTSRNEVEILPPVHATTALRCLLLTAAQFKLTCATTDDTQIDVFPD